MDTTASPASEGNHRLARVWAGALLPPVAWAIDLGASLMLTRTVVAVQRKWPLVVVGAAAFVLALAGFVLSRREWRAHTALLARGDDTGHLAASRSVTRWGMALGVFFALVIAAMAVPLVVFGPRDIP